LRYVIDPNINGIGTAPLEAMLDFCVPNGIELDLNSVEVIREYTTSDGRIDLLVRIDDSMVLGIENKIFSRESSHQTMRYERDIHKEFPDCDCYFIFLTPYKSKASAKDFIPVSYAQLYQAFRDIHYVWKADVRKSVLWEDFLEHLKGYIMMKPDKVGFSPRTQLYLENYQMISDLQKAFSEDWPGLLNLIEAQLIAHLKSDEWVVVVNKNRYTYHLVYKRSWAQNNLFVHYEFNFAPENLIKKQFAFMSEVEGSEANKFFNLYVPHFAAMKESYSAKKIEYRPSARKHAFAWKTYQFDFQQNDPFEKLAMLFIHAYDEFSFLNEGIENTLEEYRFTL
jgi:hypothetical protein